MSYIGGATSDGETAIGRGSRRQKFAGYLRAANELRQSYQASYNNRGTGDEFTAEELGLSSSFPEVKVARNATEEMVLFPSYARRHTKTEKRSQPKPPPQDPIYGDDMTQQDPGDADYWKREWAIYEDANAVVDVDIRGWIYSPHRGPLNRKNRLLMGIARRLSGIPAPGDNNSSSRASSHHRERLEDDLVEREANNIVQKGENEADVAGRGGYSEGRGRLIDLDERSSRNPSPRPGRLQHPVTDSSLEMPSGATFSGRNSWTHPDYMTQEELKMANTHLLSRLRPFLTNPSVNMSLTVFFYNEEKSQSRQTVTNDSGHFNLRAALDFVPTHVRVLASEDLSASEEVLITEPNGVSLISDIDDTIKHSAISAGAREIFRNAFIRNLDDLTIHGVKEWYNDMADRGVKMHYVSNSPWQMYPLLVSYFAKSGLPPGSFHLKQYSGMLQGIFEPVAERKRGTLDRILGDFPERRFILVGDSGEADLEVYTETAIMNPGRILGIFIRDVTTTPKPGFFDPSSMAGQGSKPPFPSRPPTQYGSNNRQSRPTLPNRPLTSAAPPESGATSDIGDLIDFSTDVNSEPPSRTNSEPLDRPAMARASSSKSIPPVLPRKPIALRTKSSEFATQSRDESSTSPTVGRKAAPPPPPKPRKLSNSQQSSTENSLQPTSSKRGPPPLPPDRNGYRASAKNRLSTAYNSLPSASSYLYGTPPQNKPSTESPRSLSTSPHPPAVPTNSKPSNISPSASIRSNTSNVSTSSSGAPALPPRRGITSYPAAAAQYASNKWYGTDGYNEQGEMLSKREDAWNKRWARAEEVLKKKGVVLKSWRVGGDVIKEAERLVEKGKELGPIKGDQGQIGGR